MGIFTDVWAGIRDLIEPTEGLGQAMVNTAIDTLLYDVETESNELTLTALHTLAQMREYRRSHVNP